MRETKYRAKANQDMKGVKKGKWVYGSYIENHHPAIVPFGNYHSSPQIEHAMIWVDGKTKGQYTGLKDKNGQEIYENDIVKMIEVTNGKIEEYVTPIIWEDCSFVMKSGGEDYDTFLASWCGDNNKTYPLFEIEVIGNIYEIQSY